MLWPFLALAIMDASSTNIDIPAWAYLIYIAVAVVYLTIEIATN